VTRRLPTLSENAWLLLALALLLASLLVGRGSVGSELTLAWLPVGALLLVAVAQPRAGLMALVLLFPARPALEAAHGPSALQLLGVAVLAGTGVRWMRERRRLRVGLPHAVLAGLVGLGAASLTVEVGASSVWNLTTWAKALALSIAVVELVGTRAALWRMCAAFALSASLTAALMLADYLPYALGAFDSPDPMRYRWTVSPDSSTLATFLGAGCVAVLPLLDPVRIGWRRVLPWGMVVLSFAGVLALGSRLVWLAILFAGGVYLVAGRGVGGRWRRAVAFVALPLVIGGLGLALGLSDPTLGKRVSRSTESVHKASGGRSDIWRVGWRIVAAHPLRGVGLGNFPRHFDEARETLERPVRSRPGRSPHNTLLGLWAELGFLAPLTLLAALALLARPLLRSPPGAAAWLAILAYLTAVMMGQDQLGTLHPWVIVGLLAAAGRVLPDPATDTDRGYPGRRPDRAS
jgi:hypothetical protein